MLTIFLVDDHVMVRRGLEARLAATGRYRIAGEAASLSGARGLLASPEFPPDLIILDLELGDENGLELIGTLEKQHVAAGELSRGRIPAILVYSVFDDPFRIQSALHMGARGYVSKSAGEAEMLAAVEAVLAGRIWLDPRLELKTKAMPDIYALFTKREREILELVQKRYDNGAIAKKLSLSLRTIENYLSRIYAKTGAATRNELLAL
ncbi:response regulator transcription factor [Treponema primitia]|uniref:response regulator n=1 Tax=Treponema primitia TaxID=88058 RepID=UPI0039812FD1